jgi:chromosome segregation ATPase
MVKMAKRKPHEIVPLMLRLRESLRQKLAKDAERNAKSLNAEIGDRLEKSYQVYEQIKALTERVKELLEHLGDARRSSEENRRKLAEVSQAQEANKEANKEAYAQITKLQEEYGQELRRLKEEANQVKTAAAVVDALLGDDVAKKKAIRIVALLLANKPGLALSDDGVQMIAQEISAAIKGTAGQEVH